MSDDADGDTAPYHSTDYINVICDRGMVAFKGRIRMQPCLFALLRHENRKELPM